MQLQMGPSSMLGAPCSTRGAFRPLAAPCTVRQPTRHLQLCRGAAVTAVEDSEMARTKLAVLHTQTAQAPPDHPDALPLADRPLAAALSNALFEEQDQLQTASSSGQEDAGQRPTPSEGSKGSAPASSSAPATAQAGSRLANTPITATFSVGDIVTGQVIFTNQKGSRVRILEHEGVVAFMPAGLGPMLCDEGGSQASSMRTGARRDALQLRQNVTRSFKVLNIPDDMTYDGRGPLVSAIDVDTRVAWERVQQAATCMMEDHETATVTIVDTNNGGLLASFLGVKAFMPWSSLVRERGGPVYTKESARVFIGQHMEVAVLECSVQQQKLTLSPRQALVNKAFRTLTVGTLVHGIVRQFARGPRGCFGAYIELDNMHGIQGLLHVSNISVRRVHDPQDVLREGEHIAAVVLGLDATMADRRRKILLSTEHLEAEAGDMLRNKQAVFDNAPLQAEVLRQHMAAVEEQRQQEQAEQAWAQEQ